MVKHAKASSEQLKGGLRSMALGSMQLAARPAAPALIFMSKRHFVPSLLATVGFGSRLVRRSTATPRMVLWRALVRQEHTLGTLSEITELSAQEVRHHLEHVVQQAKTLKNKSSEWRSERHIPVTWDVSAVRLELIAPSCSCCDWEAKNATKRLSNVKICKRCGSRDMSPMLIRLTCRSKPGRAGVENLLEMPF